MTFELPDWINDMPLPSLRDDESLMRYVIALAWRNVREGTGGPFAAMIYDAESGIALSRGVNLVLSTRNSVLHAEIIAIMLASDTLQTSDLSSVGGLSLYSSAEPCAMCMGAIPWSGIKRVVISARDEDVRAIGFDEGHKPTDWLLDYTQRGIEVVRDVERAASHDVLKYYAEHGGVIY